MTITINVLYILVLIVAGSVVGYLLRSKEIKRKLMRVQELENEMMSCHAEILKLHQQIAHLNQPSNTGVPVVPLKHDTETLRKASVIR